MTTSISKMVTFRQLCSAFHVKAQAFWSDRYAKKLWVGNTAALFLEGIVQQRTLGEIADHLNRAQWLQKWLGIDSIHPSSLYRKLNSMPTEALRDLYLHLVKEVAALHERKPLRLGKRLGTLAAIDSTTITLGCTGPQWAYHQNGHYAVKVHTCLKLTGDTRAYPHRSVLSTAHVADLDAQVLQHLVHEQVVTYLFDRGYIHYHQFIEWTRKDLRFVARIKASNKPQVIRRRTDFLHPIAVDADVKVRDPKTGETATLRLVEYDYLDRKGRTHRIRVLTNRWDWTAAEVAQAYKYRWKIEQFFKCMKQHLHVKHPYSTKPQGVWNVVYLNLIAYLLMEGIRQQEAPHLRIGQVCIKFRHYAEEGWDVFQRALHPVRQRTSKGRRKKGGRPRKHPPKGKPLRLIFW